jgi:nicotinamide riboside kinase
MIIALLGAESTGKTQLAIALAERLNARGLKALAVPEYLREWCDAHERTPHAHEQLHIAHTQTQRIDAAAKQADVVLADTTALMTAVYSQRVFGDSSLYPYALQQQRGCALTLVTGLDMPWESDGIQRDGPQVREAVDALLRGALIGAKMEWSMVYGVGEERVLSAMQRINIDINLIANYTNSTPAKSQNDSARFANRPWVWACDKCSDPECEHRLFRALGNRA